MIFDIPTAADGEPVIPDEVIEAGLCAFVGGLASWEDSGSRERARAMREALIAMMRALTSP